MEPLRHPKFPPRVKVTAFVLEGLNSISTTYYFYFVYWFLKSEFGFGARKNLLWAVAMGAVYVVASLQGGRYGQRRGYLRALKIGFGTMSVCFFLGWGINHLGLAQALEVGLQAALMIVATVGICFTWPNLEAIVSEGEPGPRLQNLIGVYNLVWSGAGALAYFTGGALIEALGARQLIFLVPAVMIGGQYAVTVWVSRASGVVSAHPPAVHGPLAGAEERQRTAIRPQTFLRMSWLANPCAYVAISTAIPLVPTLAEHLALGTRAAGFFCSIWLFARTLAFVALWRWDGWHYRFRYLGLAFVGMVAGFLFIFLSATFTGLPRAQVLWLATAAQVVFGVGLGLIYYSSLFYSMDVGDTKGDHGGIHEAAIGAGILGGPLVGAVAQFARPGSPTAAAWTVSAVLLVGLGGMLALRSRGRR